MARLRRAHRTLIVGEERPLPGGLAKGVGNASPETPWTKWGTALARNIPAKKQAIQEYQGMAAEYSQ
jgi:hypothetical protein